jgi:hypothetical protein
MDPGQVFLVNISACVIGFCLYALVLQALNRTANTFGEILNILSRKQSPSTGL